MPKLSGSSTLNPDGLILPKEQWRNQWYRVIRWKEKVECLSQRSLTKKVDFLEIEDTFVAFIQNSYHLRDWVSVSHPNLKPKITNLFKNNFELKCSRDICNGYKHKKIVSSSIDKDFIILQSYDYFAKRKGSMNYITYKIIFSEGTDSKTYDLFDFTNRTFLIWKGFIEKELV